MKSRYFEFVEIEKEILDHFFSVHSELKGFFNDNIPFTVRISKKPFAGLIHTIISDGETSESLSTKWQQLIDFSKKVTVKNIVALSEIQLVQIVGIEKCRLIKKIAKDVFEGVIDIDSFEKMPSKEIITLLKKYPELTENTINIFLIFSLFKKDILCDTDPDFMTGLKIFLNKKEVTSKDITSIKTKYADSLSLFSLCMWRIRNERQKK